MSQALPSIVSPLDLDVVLRDTIAEFGRPLRGELAVSPIRVALAAVSIDRNPMFAAAVIHDLAQACAIVATGSREGLEWRERLLANAKDHYTRAVWHIVAAEDIDDIVVDLEWLEQQLQARYAVARQFTAQRRSLPAFLPVPDPCPEWSEADGAPPLADPFVPRGWTYADWYALAEADVHVPCELHSPLWFDPFSGDDGLAPSF